MKKPKPKSAAKKSLSKKGAAKKSKPKATNQARALAQAIRRVKLLEKLLAQQAEAQAKLGAGFDSFLIKQAKKNHKAIVQSIKSRWRLSKSKNPKKRAKLAELLKPHSNTSAAAFKSIDSHRARMRFAVMKEIIAQGANGATTYEIEVALSMLHQTASARMYELTEQGRVVDSGKRRKTGSGRSAVVHILPDFMV